MTMISIMIKRIRLNHGLHHLLTPIFYPLFTSLVMETYNLDYVHSVLKKERYNLLRKGGGDRERLDLAREGIVHGQKVKKCCYENCM